MIWLFGREEFLLTFQNQLDVIQGLKDKAWKATNYSVLGQAAVFALYRFIDCPTPTENWWMTAFSASVFFWAFGLVNNLQGGVCVRRERMENLRTLKFDPPELTFHELWEKLYEIKPPDWWNLCKRWKNDWPISLAYAAAILVPPVIVSGFIWQWWS